MQTSLKQIYLTYLRAGGDMRKALEKSMVRGKLPRAVVNELAATHAEYYECHAHETESGAWRFFNDADDVTSTNRHDAATRQWNRAIAPLTGIAKSNRGGSRNKMSAVDRMLAQFEKLSLKDQRAFVKALPRNI